MVDIAKPTEAARELVRRVISAYHTTRLADTPFEDHILSKPHVLTALTALTALADEVAGEMRARCAKECDAMGAYEQEGFGLDRATQNYFRARNAIRAIPLPSERK